MTQTYKTVREAAIAGLQQAIVLAKRDGWEYAGFVFAIEGGFTISDIVTSQEPHRVSAGQALPKWIADASDELEAQLKASKKDSAEREALKSRFRQLNEDASKVIKGVFHTHLTHEPWATSMTRKFSGADLQNAIDQKSLAWLGLTDTGEVFEVDGRDKDVFLASAGELEDATDSQLLGLLMLLTGNEMPFVAQGTRIYAGNQEEEERQAA